MKQAPFRAKDALFADYSLEMTAKDIDSLEEAARTIPAGTRVSVTYLPNEDFDTRVRAAAMVRRLGMVPVPHISARRLPSAAELERFLDALSTQAAIDHVFVIAGDTPRAEGPYDDSLAVIKSGILSKYSVRHVGISGYPEGHPQIADEKLWQAMRDKQSLLRDLGHDFDIITQFGFDAEPVFSWMAALRQHGVDAPVRIGVAGPASIKTLLRFAARCGVGASAKVMTKYGVSLTRLLGSAGPDPFVNDLIAGLDPSIHGAYRLHFYPFGGLLKTAAWVRDFRAKPD